MATLELYAAASDLARQAISAFPNRFQGYVDLDRNCTEEGGPTGALTEVLGLQEGIGELAARAAGDGETRTRGE